MFVTEEDLEKFHMQRTVNLHRIHELLGRLKKDDLGTLEILLMSMCAEDGRVIAAQYLGAVKQTLILKHGECACGEEHETAEDLLGQRPDKSPPASVNLLLPTATESLDVGQSAATLMQVYRLEIRPSDGAIVCRDCGLWYTSIVDRMLKGPDDCHGCHMKSAQG